jgi:hypothetical protein
MGTCGLLIIVFPLSLLLLLDVRLLHFGMWRRYYLAGLGCFGLLHQTRRARGQVSASSISPRSWAISAMAR